MKVPSTEMVMPYVGAAADAVLAATHLWLERAVIGLKLCPFAGAVYRNQQIRYALTAARTADDLLAELEREMKLLIQLDPNTVDTTLLIHPLAMSDFLDYHFFLAEANAALRNLGLRGVLQIASFHPQYEFAGSAPDDIENYSNRSPYPMLHLLREASLDRGIAAFPASSEIPDKNIETLRTLGHAGWRRLWERDSGQG